MAGGGDGMNRRRRARRRALFIVLPLLLILAFVIYFRYTPYVREAARVRVVNAASDWLVGAINAELRSGRIDFSHMTYLEKDVNGSITAVRTNTAELNCLKSEIMELLGNEMPELCAQELGVPIGSILLPDYFAGRGVCLPVRVVALSSSDAAFFTTFEAAGINQTMQRVRLNVSVTLTVLSPAGTQQVTADSDVIVAETVVVGTVPKSYVSVS